MFFNSFIFLIKYFSLTLIKTDKTYRKRKKLNDQVYTGQKKYIYKSLLVLKTYSKNIFLFRRFYSYFKILKIIKNTFLFKQKKFNSFFLYRLDFLILKLSYFKNLIQIR
jgi:hypothetical protein